MMQKARQPKTILKKKADNQRTWFVFDATGKTLGRFASEISKVLRGKHKPDYTPSSDTGDGVIVIHADKIVVTGAKEAQKIYKHHTGFMSGLVDTPYRVMKARHPERIIERAVKGMMPKNRIAEHQYKRLRVYNDDKYAEVAQNPVVVNI
jgi:large subunit ribosomal protein L13